MYVIKPTAMTFSEFQQLNNVQQLNTVLDNGYAISEKKDKRFLHVRYHIFNFNVVLHYQDNFLRSLEVTAV